MRLTIKLPDAKGGVELYTLGEPASYSPPSKPFTSRILFAAAHVVADSEADNGEGKPAVLDWDATLRYRHHLWSYGFGVAEAMDTAQRGMGLDWQTTRELIRLSVQEAKSVGGRIACGAGTDQLSKHSSLYTLEDVVSAYEEQIAWIENCGGSIILMASRALAAVAKSPEDYLKVYRRILEQTSQPVILHWLGDMFDPQLKGYWGADDWQDAAQSLFTIIQDIPSRIDGMKMSLLDSAKEVAVRSKLPNGVKMYTGDDFNYDTLIKGDAHGYSHGLLGIFDAIAPAAAAAMHALESGDLARYDAILAPTVPLSRHIFESPTFYYKSGIVFMAYLNGYQDHFRMVAGLEDKRSLEHYVGLFKLADKAGLLKDPELAVRRMSATLDVKGVSI